MRQRAGNTSHFTAPISDLQRTAFAATNPFRYAFKHAHSQANPEKDWGLFTRQAISLRFGQSTSSSRRCSRNDQQAGVFVPSNTLVIASSVSNGGGASIQAVEGDTSGLIDARGRGRA